MALSKELEFHITNVFSRNLDAYQNGIRFIMNQGSSRSSKTYSILQLLIFIAIKESGTKISIVRKTLPSLKKSSMLDFFDILDQLGLYKKMYHNKTNNTYTFPNKSIIEFFSIDDHNKVKGMKRDICYLNEATELDQMEFTQLDLRTSKCFFIDYNPSESESYLYNMIERDNCILIKSTYKDNIFLGENNIKAIEELINVDEGLYRIYALGERAISQTRIYTHFKQFTELPEYDDYIYGADWGYNHPAALVKIYYSGKKVYVQELIYESGLTVNDLCNKIKSLIDDDRPIYADSARPDIIQQLIQMGLNCLGAKKDVKEGIDLVKSTQVYLDVEAINIWKEYRTYSWKSKGNVIYDEPIKIWDDALDGIRYALYTHRNNKKEFKFEFDWL